jgi:GTP cyclohydrolase I
MSTTELPEHVRKLVAEIETEIGEEYGVNGRDAEDERTRPIVGSGSLATPHGPVEDAVREILVEIGEDPDRQGLRGTPDRVHRMYAELTAGYHVDQERLVNGAVFDVDYSEMVVVKNIPFYSLCEHHLLPFIGKAHVAYIPNGKVLGLSKVARIVDMYARRLQIQENLSRQIADAVQQVTGALGVAVVIEAKHMCMMMRGVEKQNSSMITSVMLGEFRENAATRSEFLSLIK